MATNFSTFGGQVTRGEAFSKLLHHLDEARDQANIARARESDRQHRLTRKAATTIREAEPQPQPVPLRRRVV